MVFGAFKRFLQHIGSVFHQGRKKRTKDEKETLNQEKEPDPLDIIVERYLQNNYINIPMIPQRLERHIYRMILSSILDIFKKEEESLHLNVLGYRIGYNLSTMIIPSLCKQSLKEKPKEKQNKDKNKDKDKDKDEKFSYIEKIVDRFIDSQHVNIRLVPTWVERNLYTNILILLYGILEDTLKHMCVHLLGHDIRFSLHKSINNENKSKNDNNDDKNNKNVVDLDRHEKIIEEIVDMIMEQHNIFLIPDFIERGFYKMSLKISLFFLCTLINDARLNIFGQNMDFWVSPATHRPNSSDENPHPPI